MLITRKVKLICSDEQKDSLEKTAFLFKELYNFLVKKGWGLKECSRYKLHYGSYKEAREAFPELPAEYVITGIMKASASITSGKTKQRQTALENNKRQKKGLKLRREVHCPKMVRSTILALDVRLITIGKDSAKITTAAGRTTYQLQLYPYIQEIWQYKRKGCEIKKYKGVWYLCMVFELPEPKFKKGTTLGVDLGVNNIAVCSNNKFFNSKKLKKVKGKFRHNRKNLQSKGTKSAKRKLKVVSGKEKRFVRDVNHCISKSIVESGYDMIALEKLDLRAEKKLGKSFNKKLGNWSWYQLETFVKYKGPIKGVEVINVPSFYTSQACSKCGHTQKTNRLGAEFHCKECGFQLHSDLNAARNIAKLAQAGKSGLSRLLSISPTAGKPANVVSLRA